MRGRKPIPVNLKVIKGTARPDRDNVQTPEFDLVDDFPPAPQHLNPDGASMWNELGRQLVAAKVLQMVDLYSLEQLCFAWQRFRQKAKAGMELTAAEDTSLKSLFSEFGMTPAARRKVPVGPDEKTRNRFARFGKRTGETA